MGQASLQYLRLSAIGQRYLQQHPERARRVAAEAVEAAARREAGDDDIPEALRPFVRERAYGSEIIGPTEAARRLAVTRGTLYDWVRKRKLLAWQTSKRGLKIPAEQILGPERVVAGIDQVWSVLVDPELVWVFLSEAQPFRDDVARPIDKLKAGEIDQVVGAAQAYGSTPA